MRTIATIITGVASATFFFATVFYPNSQEDIKNNTTLLKINPWAAPTAQRKCQDTTWVWYTNSYNPTLEVASFHRDQFCRHVDRVSDRNFAPVSIRDRM